MVEKQRLIQKIMEELKNLRKDIEKDSGLGWEEYFAFTEKRIETFINELYKEEE